MSDIKKKIEQEIQNELSRLQTLKRLDDERKAKELELENKKRWAYILTKELMERFAAEFNLNFKQEKPDPRRYDIAYSLYEKKGLFSRNGDMVVQARLGQKGISEGYHGANVIQEVALLQIGGIKIVSSESNIPGEREFTEKVNDALAKIYAIWKVKKLSTTRRG